MATSTTIYKCDYCSYTAKTKTTIVKHEASCLSNTTRKSLIDTEIETIRQTATSIPHLLELLDAFWLSHGLKVTFSQYPATWYDSISNYSTAPAGYPTNWKKDPAIPSGYPGWKGNWKGTVTKLANYKGKASDPGFSEARGGSFTKDSITIPFIYTGSGSGGKDFQYDGMLFLYDFPLMHEQWKTNLGEYKLLGERYDTNVKALMVEFKRVRNEYIANQPDSVALASLDRQLTDLRNTLSSTRTATISHYTNEFAKANPINIPDIPSAFIDNKAYADLVNLNIFVESAPPEIASLFTRTSELAETLTTYSSKYPEYFI